ncbi:MAG: 16S rRNA (guanine(966)-N(2))-methyltransferase RsmD [Paracoccaceae bacterium]|nr:16S rRNA (guanine(966)-N(2))-methyltransferase RsmD [Paracoccaceae bacterium]MDG1738659.1 16S rRNA (guanine(966)-N(2))-methyltransferase RsmD [Paracoccaceae bacterium]MDG2258099.1 16S rRNA (guanine(966)-N(2))-methyltransferase RsmD [Paracoccaceae bacterium]
MRIIAGEFRGRALAAVGKGDAGAHLRPTTDRVRESLFNVLVGGSYGDPITNARVLDLFAGTGALGLEALSRGAQHVTFVDDGRKAQDLLRQNIELCRASTSTKIFRSDVKRLGANKGEPYNLIFLDPPYGKGLGEQALALAFKHGWVADDALIVWEESAEIEVPEQLELFDKRKYGDTRISILGVI